MADEAPFDIKLAAWLGRAVGDSAPLLADLSFLTEALGAQLPSTVLGTPQVTGASQQAQVAAKEVRVVAEELPDVVAAGDASEIVAKLIRLGKALSDFYKSADALMSAVRSGVTPASVPDAVARAAAENLAERLVKAVSDYAIASAITDHYPQLAFGLKIAGLLDWEFQHRDADHELSRAYVRKALRLDRIKNLIKAPAAHLRDTIGWGDPSFDPSGFFRVARDFFQEEDTIEIGVQAGEPFLRACILLKRDSSVSPPGLSLTLLGDADADVQDRTALSDEWDLVAKANLRMIGGVSARIAPPLTFKLKPLNGQITGEFSQFVERNEAARPFDILNGGGVLVMAASNAAAGVSLRAEWDETLRTATLNSMLFAKLQGATIRIDASKSDGFIGRLLSGADVEGQFDLGVEWQADSGLRVTGNGGIEVALALHKQIGPVELDVLYLALKIRDDGTLSFETSAALTAKLGPLTATADRLGALLDLRFAEGTDAKIGPLDFALGFKPPNGVGLSLDVGVVKGGGYLFFDFDREEYAGVLELAIARDRHGQGDRPDHDEDARRLEGLLAADHHHRGVRHRHPARLRLHARRPRRPAWPQPHDEPAAAGRGRAHRRRQQHHVPGEPGRERAAHHQRPADHLPALRRAVPHRPDGEARLGHAAARSPFRSASSSRSRATSPSSACSRWRCRPTMRR